MRGHWSRVLACPDDELESVLVSGHKPGLERLALSRAGGGQRLAALRHKYLRRERSRRSVTLVDRTNHHLFQSLLYHLRQEQSPRRVRHPSRNGRRRSANSRVAMVEVIGVEVERRQVILAARGSVTTA